MRILLRDVNTKQYLNSSGGTDDIDQARDFEAGAAALIFAAAHDLSEVEVIYAFQDPTYNFRTGMVGLQRHPEVTATTSGNF